MVRRVFLIVAIEDDVSQLHVCVVTLFLVGLFSAASLVAKYICAVCGRSVMVVVFMWLG